MAQFLAGPSSAHNDVSAEVCRSVSGELGDTYNYYMIQWEFDPWLRYSQLLDITPSDQPLRKITNVYITCPGQHEPIDAQPAA